MGTEKEMARRWKLAEWGGMLASGELAVEFVDDSDEDLGEGDLPERGGSGGQGGGVWGV